MGTTYTVKAVAVLEEQERAALEAEIEERLEEVNAKMSTYQPYSEISRFNRHFATTPFELSAESLAVFRAAQEMSRLSGGAFDVTVGPLVNAWGFGPEGSEPQGPSATELERLRRRVGWEKLEVGETAVRKSDPNVYCDLSAVAKGYATDRVAEHLEARGVRDYMVEVGGEVRTAGENGHGQPWRIGIERPEESVRELDRVVELSGLSMATSGDYRNFRELPDGRRISHTIDPRTGRPVPHRGASVSVIREYCLEADAWATALQVLGPEEGYRLAERESVAALFLVHGEGEAFQDVATPAFERFLERGMLDDEGAQP